MIMIVMQCFVIFSFSAQKANDSSNSSSKIVDIIIDKILKTNDMSETEKEILKLQMTAPIRKMAHFSIYFILGILLILCANTFNTSDKKRILYSWIIGTLYACTDEIHQIFVDGRSGELRDVCIDSTRSFIWNICNCFYNFYI